eukprot:8106735-Pyramimonas_sp.AAC.1
MVGANQWGHRGEGEGHDGATLWTTTIGRQCDLNELFWSVLEATGIPAVESLTVETQSATSNVSNTGGEMPSRMPRDTRDSGSEIRESTTVCNRYGHPAQS